MIDLSLQCKGLGNEKASVVVYMANRPKFDFALEHNERHEVAHICSVVDGEISAVGNACGNGWRKVFNVYAKLMYALPRAHFPFAEDYTTWQQYRDGELLRAHSNTALIFEAQALEKHDYAKAIIIMGRTYAKSLALPKSLKWENEAFAIDAKNKLIVCPYFDYRQLSNVKISYLQELISQI
ncbi:MAG: hypothetical protein ACI9O6_000503 [Glaciecola sp.]|jgi:hypothetical protein